MKVEADRLSPSGCATQAQSKVTRKGRASSPMVSSVRHNHREARHKRLSGGEQRKEGDEGIKI